MTALAGEAGEARAHLGDGDYVTDVAYTRTFVDHLSPSMLRHVAALNGFAAPSIDELEYCELGSGQGLTTATLAAASPRARFLGVDFNPEHVEMANEWARRGGLDNVRFLQRDFAQLEGEDIAPLDYIAMHGVYSWVGPEKRAAILSFAKAKLKPGGLLYVSYNALPGWAAIEPLRKMMFDHTAGLAATSTERARAGLQYAQRLCDAGAVYFESHPTAKSMLALMQKAGLPYVAHEYFHQQWHPRHFADVAREMAEHGFGYVGQLPLYLNFRELATPPALKELAREIDDRLAFESLKDFAVNEFFRSDIYVNGGPPRSEATTRAYLESTPFGTLAPSAQIRRELRLPHYVLQLVGPLFDAVIAAIAEGAASAEELATRPSLAGFGVRRIADALQTLSLGGQVVPMRAHASNAASAANGAEYRVASPYNRMTLTQPLANGAPIVLASPVAATGLPVSMLDAVCIRLLTEVRPEDRAAWIQDLLERQPLRIVVSGEPVKDRAQLARRVAQELERFTAQWPAKLADLGILERA